MPGVFPREHVVLHDGGMRGVRPRSLGDGLGAVLPGCRDVDGVAEAVFAAVGAHVPFAFACLATMDPSSGLIARAFKSHPLAVGDEEFAAAEYGGPDVNQFADIAGRRAPVGVLSVDTDGRPERCRRFRDFLQPHFGFSDELRLVCRARGVSWGALALYRGAGDVPFTAREARELSDVHELLALSLQRVLFAASPPTTGSATGAAVIIVDDRDRVSDMTAAADEQIVDLGGWDGESLPSNVLAVVARARTSGQPATTRVLGRSGRWSSLRAIALDGGPTPTRSVVVTIEEAPRSAVGRMTLAARGLTAREQDVAVMVLKGASTKVIASALHLSPHTVQDHLKAVFRKLGVSSRREMIARLVLDDSRPTRA